MICIASDVIRRHHNICPAFFRHCCTEAAGGMGYDHPAYHLTIHLGGEIPDSVESSDEWERILGGLQRLIESRNDAGILEWFCRWFPACMALVPRRRRHCFVKGVHSGAVRLGWTNVDAD